MTKLRTSVYQLPNKVSIYLYDMDVSYDQRMEQAFFIFHYKIIHNSFSMPKQGTVVVYDCELLEPKDCEEPEIQNIKKVFNCINGEHSLWESDENGRNHILVDGNAATLCLYRSKVDGIVPSRTHSKVIFRKASVKKFAEGYFAMPVEVY